jgi:predicted ATPase/class 3 adenylate cyclase
VTAREQPGGVPTGTVSFLFTDVEGSTRLWQEHPAEMTAALEHHDKIVREAISSNDGYVFSTAGDAFAAAFHTSTQAIDAAVSAQRALLEASWSDGVRIRVRMGIHTGEAVERGGDYFGSTLNRGARVMAAGHGGQILLTATAHGGLDKTRARSVDLGEHALRDIDGVERIFQVVAEGIESDFPEIRTLSDSRSRLPTQRSSLIGRNDDIAAIRSRLLNGRLVTLTGAGGCGKTRLAIEVAGRESQTFTDGAFFVDLARIGDDDEVAEAFAMGIDFVPDSSVPTVEQIGRRIGSKTVLLVVDNCEHLIDETADQVDGLLAACPNLRVLATSREALDVDGEIVFRLQSLDVEARDGNSPAVRLFLDRSTDAGVELLADDDAVIAAICERLDGLPLAIELAAARSTVLSPSQILERLTDRFTLLTGGRRRTRGRQQTLEATIDWSYDLLDLTEQDALRQVSVMPGAFDLALASAVLAETPARTVDLLETLVARSLLQTARDGRSGDVRYRLLETIRVYAYQRLVDDGGAETTHHRHARHVADRLDAYPMAFTMMVEHRLLADDALLALDWAHGRDDRTLGARLVSCAAPIFIGRGLSDKGTELHEWAADIDDPIVRSTIFTSHALLALANGGDFSELAARALDAAGESSFPRKVQCHLLQALNVLFTEPAGAELFIRRAENEMAASGASMTDHASVDLWTADLALWRRDYRSALDVSTRSLHRPDVDPLTAMNIHGAHLLAALLCEEDEAVHHHLTDPDIDAMRRQWNDGARRGEHWLLSYEAIRCAALAWTGDPASARRHLADAVTMVGPDAMTGVDDDLLGAFAWACLSAGEIDRARELLDDTYGVARSPNTQLLLTEARERANGITDATAESRIAELIRRDPLLATISSERRTQRILENELDRLHLR